MSLINTLKMRKQEQYSFDDRIQYLWGDFKDRIFKIQDMNLNNMKRKMLLEAPTKDFLLRLDLID